VSAEDVTAFIHRIEPNLDGVPPFNIFNYDKSPFRDDPATENAFFSVDAKHCEKVQNHSKTAFSVMFWYVPMWYQLPEYGVGTGM